MIDLIRALIGEVAVVTATGDPPGEHPTDALVVHLRGENANALRSGSGPAPWTSPA